MEWLKEFLGDELYAQIESKLKGNDKVKVGNLANGEYVSKSKFDDKVRELESANTQINSLSATVKEFEGVDIKELQTQLAASKEKYDADMNALKSTIKKQEAIDKWLDEHPSKHRSLLKTQFDVNKIEIDKDGTVKGIEEIGKTVAETYKDLFVAETEQAGGMPQGGSPASKDPSQMSMDEYKAWRANQ